MKDVRFFGILALGWALLALGACGDRGLEGKDCPAGVKAKTPSGYCIPRYLSLKRGEVYGRKGPGKDYPPSFVYHAQGLPVQVIDETSEWRRICDPDGGSAWVSRSMVIGRRTVMAQGAQPIPLRRFPKAGAGAGAFLNARALASLEQCRAGWCKVSVGRASGWVQESEVWGIAPTPQCH